MDGEGIGEERKGCSYQCTIPRTIELGFRVPDDLSSVRAQGFGGRRDKKVRTKTEQ